MNTQQFSQWHSFHAARFPDWQRWLAVDVPKQQSQADVVEAMFEQLAEVSLDDAKAATLQLSKSDSFDEWPDKHIKEVRRVARKFASERLAATAAKLAARNGMREPTYKCLTCLDDGRVIVFHPTTMRAAKETPELILDGTKTLYRCAVACNCEAGNVFVEHQKMPRLRASMIVWPADLMQAKDVRRFLIDERSKPGRNEWTGDENF